MRSVDFRDFGLKAYFNGRIKFTPDAHQSIACFLETILPSIIGTGTSDIGSFANALNMHPKKLQRLLKDEDSNFSNIRDNIRKNLASKLLLYTSIPISHIAALLEYPSNRTFTAAFKKWNDLTPSTYRQENSTK